MACRGEDCCILAFSHHQLWQALPEVGHPAAQVSGSPAPLCSKKGTLQRGTLRGRDEDAGTGGCLGAAFGSHWGSFPGQPRRAAPGERCRCPAAAGAPSARAAQRARRCLGKVPSAPRQQRSPAAAAGKQRRPSEREEARKVLCEVADAGAEGQSPWCPHGHSGVAAAFAAARAGRAARGGAGTAAAPQCPCLSRAALPDTCARVHPESHPGQDGMGDRPAPTPPALGARHSAARGTQGVPPYILGRGSGCGSTAPALTCGAAGDARSPPPSRGRQRGYSPHPGERHAEKPCGRNFLSPLPSRAGLRRVTREKEGRKEGREGREGVRPLCNIIGCVAGLVLAGRACPLGRYKRYKSRSALLVSSLVGQQPGAAGSEAAGPFAPTKGRTQ